MTKNAKLELLIAFYKSKGLAFTWHQIEVIQRAASNMQTYAEHYCNGVIDSDEYEKKQKQIHARIEKVLCGVRPKITIQGDPRGYCLKLKTPSGDEIAPHHFN